MAHVNKATFTGSPSNTTHTKLRSPKHIAATHVDTTSQLHATHHEACYGIASHTPPKHELALTSSSIDGGVSERIHSLR